MDHIAKTVIKLEKIEGEKEGRRATIVKHRSLPEGKSVVFFITENGIS